ncbi:MAG: ABC transporter permease [Muribaculaceae bacterium]|nr:ABC transporter permease [Muribaculaceae bacterium]
MNLRILGALLRKEVIMMRHNPIIPKMIVGLPIMALLIIPLVATFDVKNVEVAVVDNDRSQLSRRIIADIDASKELDVLAVTATHDEAMILMEKDKVDVILSIPSHFARDISELDVEANGVNATKGMMGMQYVVSSAVATIRQANLEDGLPVQELSSSVLYRFNPTLNFRHYMIPALMVFLIIMICGFLPALNLVSEKESGTIEAMNVTPVSRTVFVLSKLIPFWVTGILVVTVGILIGFFVYGLAPVGNILCIYLAAILLSLVMSGLGVTIANKSATMLQTIFVMFAFIIIFQLMGGLFTPIGSMPEWAQYITYAVPPRFFNEIMRAIYLRGTTIAELGSQFLWLTGYALLAITCAALTYKKRS